MRCKKYVWNLDFVVNKHQNNHRKLLKHYGKNKLQTVLTLECYIVIKKIVVFKGQILRCSSNLDTENTLAIFKHANNRMITNFPVLKHIALTNRSYEVSLIIPLSSK